MKKTVSLLLLVGLFAAVTPMTKAASFKNCTAVNKVYPGGVSKAVSATNKGGKTKKAPPFDAKLYKTIVKMVRGKEGIASEE